MDWLKQLTPIEHVFFWIAVAASVALVVQIVLLIVSFGGGGDSDFTDFDGDMDTDGGLSFFTVKGITAFFALGGWCGFAAASYLPDNIWAPILIAVATGAAALVAVGFAMRGVAKLQCSGNVVKEKLEGSDGDRVCLRSACAVGKGQGHAHRTGKIHGDRRRHRRRGAYPR